MDLFQAWFKGKTLLCTCADYFLCDSDNKNYDFFTFQNFSGFFSFVHFVYHQNLLISYTPLLRVFLNICSMHIGPKKFAR